MSLSLGTCQAAEQGPSRRWGSNGSEYQVGYEYEVNHQWCFFIMEIYGKLVYAPWMDRQMDRRWMDVWMNGWIGYLYSQIYYIFIYPFIQYTHTYIYLCMYVCLSTHYIIYTSLYIYMCVCASGSWISLPVFGGKWFGSIPSWAQTLLKYAAIVI